MKVRQSGMPDEILWNNYFDIPLILKKLEINSKVNDIAEIGCGYGTYSIPAGNEISGRLFAYDIEKEMIDRLNEKISSEGIKNIIAEQRDILENGTGLNDNSTDYVMLFNILHHETPTELFHEAYRILRQNGKIGIIHWRSDILTPRGPDLNIRPTPENLLQLFNKTMFSVHKPPFVIEPFHYGLILSKN